MGCVKCRHVGTRMGYGSVGMLEHVLGMEV